ncbi:translocation/assembly module TamB domain-containing protein [Deinococcus terrestris]|uniref:translocation/assembly module TamB domain-containing protein n=1 Tax=Deinococcus terrestris TaxID=2651870 RepID=UPI002AD2CF24|nr:translocation/assembly module TamB domain-containing protein [Deinococcus terrestris]
MTPTPPAPSRPPRSRRAGWVLLALAALLGLAAWFAPTLLGQWALRQFGGDVVTAEGVDGRLWSPGLRGARVQIPGVDATADEASVRVTGVDPRTRTLRLDAAVKNGTVNLRLGDLLRRGPASGEASGGGGWRVVLGGLDVQGTRVNVDGAGLNVPDGRFRVSPLDDGRLAVRGQTRQGDLNANVTVQEGELGNRFLLDVDADARIINHYWPGVTGGRITGQYAVGGGAPIRGDLRVRGAGLRVPEAEYVTVGDVNGTLAHRGDDLALRLAGRGWDGPVTARATANTRQQRWDVTAEATPRVAGLAQALGTTGDGALRLRATAGGWSRAEVRAEVAGAGRFAGVPFDDLRAQYAFASPSGEGELPQANTLTFRADTRLSGEQTLAGEWTFGRSGRATWAGDFAGRPLDVRAGVDARNLVTLTGEGLGGPLAGRYSLPTQALTATLNPDYGAASARVALSGTPRDLRARVTDGAAGPFRLEGTARLNGEGLRADFGAARLDLNREFRGGWSVQGLSGAGVTLSGEGDLDLTEGLLGGTLAADVPGVTGTLRGPVALNLPEQRGTFAPNGQRLVWNGDAFTLTARDLAVAGGARVNGTATVMTDRRVTGTLTAQGNGYDLTATGRGDYADLRGTAGGVSVSARTVLADDFRTTAQVEGADIAGEFALEGGGVRFALTTAGPDGGRETARGVLSGESWDAAGRVNLAALRPLVGQPDLAGTLDLALAGTGGTAGVDVRVAGASVAGTLTRRGGEVTAELRGAYADAVARLSGRVYPDVAASGPVTWQGQTLAASVAGPYGDLRARLTGRTTPLTQAGVTLPGQAVDLTATLTPRLTASGTWGDLRVRYDARTGLVAVEGTQALTAFGRSGQVQGRATWGPGFAGEVRARGTLEGGYAVALAGPWRALDVTAQGPGGLRASGTAALPEASYDLRVRGPLEGFYVDGRVRGTGAEPRGTLDVFDGAGGTARVNLHGLSDFDVRARQLTLAGQPLVGDLTARSGQLSGTLSAGPLRLVARDGRVDGSGELAGHRLTAQGRLTLPATLQDLRVNVTGPLLTASATGNVDSLRGTVRLRPQAVGEGAARASLPAQSFPLTADLTGPRVTVGGLTYAAGRWSGGLGVRYALGGRAGTVAVRGGGRTLAALPSGPLAGRVNLLPRLGGQLQTDLSPFLTALPADLRTELVAGRLVADVTAQGATLTNSGSRYLGQPLDLRAQVDWRRGVRASGTLTHPGGRVPFAYDGRDLRVRGARLDARVLRPFVEATGRVTATLTLPGLDVERASGQIGVNVQALGERVTGRLTLANGQAAGELRAGPLRLTARDGRLALTGEAADHTLTATARLRGLSEVSDVRANVTGPYLEASAAGDLTALRGSVRVRGQSFGADAAQLVLPAQTLPLSVAPTAGRINVGGLTFAGGRWDSGTNLRYTLGGRAGTVAVRGGGRTLAALPSGPLAGRVNLLPRLGGQLQTDLSPFLAALPADLRGELVAGRLVADVTPDGATLSNSGTRYLGQPLGLSGAVSWQGGVRATAELTHPGTRIPLTYDGRDFAIRGAVLDALALRPFVEATGRVTADLTVPELDFDRATGRADVNLSAAGQSATGRVTLTRGQLAGDLASDLGGLALRVRGPLYPRAEADLTLGEVRGTLTGNAADTLTLRAAGRYEGRAVDLTAVGRALTGPGASATLQATVAGGTLALNLSRTPDDWAVTGRVDVPDLGPLAGTNGWVSGSVSGTLRALRLDTEGEVAGVTFRAPATYAGGVLRVQGGTGTLPDGLGTFRTSGPVIPELRLSAKASLRDALPGEYTGQVLGSFSKPDVRVQGVLNSGVGGLQAAGTRVTARLFGRDWKADLGGEALAGTVRGRLGSGALGGLLTARLNVHAPYVAGDTRVRLDGVTGWNVRTGWLGDLRATGSVPGGALDARLTGAGPLALAASVGPARVTGTFPADLPLRPGGTLDLAALDVGALWERPGQLRATGRATLEGDTWAGAGATFAGRLDDVEGDLSGDVGATYRAGTVSLRLAGARLSGGGTLEGGRYRLSVRAEPVRLARLLPPAWDVDALTFGGTVEANGTLTGGPERVEARQVALRGEQGQAGPFSLYGRATFSRQPGTPDRLDAELDGSLRGGVLKARGALPDGVRLTVRDVDARAVGVGQVGGDLTLTGPLRDLRVSGQATARADGFDALATLSGPVRDARAHARLTLKGKEQSGILYADARDLDLGAGTVRTRVYGTARQGGNDLTLDLEGTWPRLAGTATARVGGLPAPVTLRGDGQGGYALAAGALGEGALTLTDGEGFVPNLGGTLRLRPLALVEGAMGEAAAEVTLSGPLTAPSLTGTLETREAEAFGVTLADTRGTFGGTLADLRGTLTQGTDPVLTLEGHRLTLAGLTLGAAGGTVRASGTVTLNGSPAADLTLAAGGGLEGNVRATYRARALTLDGTLGAAGLRAALDVNADPFTGWHGTVRVTGGPDGVLTAPAVLRLDGPLAQPLVSGEAGLLGAGARIVATPGGVQVRLVDGPGAQANGVLEVRPDEAGGWRWLGTAALTRPELSLSVTPQGPLADPRLTLSLRRGEWRAAGEASLQAADLDVTDGERTGQVTWTGDVLRAELPGLDLGRLNLEGVTGRLTASGTANTASGEGRVALRVTDVTTTYEVPYLGLTLGGDLTGELTLAGGRPSLTATAALPAGTLNLTAAQGEGGWTGRLSGSVRQGDGTLTADVTAGAGGLTGTLAAARYPLDLPGLSATGEGVRLDGTVALQGQTFAANLSAVNTVGAARVTGTGGLADVLPALEALGTLRPTGDGYRLRARLDEVELGELALAPGLAGRVSGEATLNDGGGTVILTSPALTLGPKQLGARVEGTLIGGDWRLRGFLGETDFLASLTGGVLSGQATLQALPLGALTTAVTGTPVGEGVVTGVARFRVPLADPLAGSATVVAERIRVTAVTGTGPQAITETLTGTGTLDYADRELRNVNIQLAGAGTWDVRGGYTRERVDLQARFDGTTFTPVLRLLPGLAGLDPSLKGTVTLSAAGTYDRPRGLLRAQNLAGSLAGLSLQVPALEGDLPDSGAFNASGRVLTGGVLGSDGTLEVRGQLSLGRLSGTTATFRGLLAPQALGALPNSVVTVTQAGEDRWTVEASSRTPATAAGPAGTLRLTGALTPRLDLSLTAQGYALPISVISARDSSLDADLRLLDDGTVVRVSGAASFARLVLGRTDAVATIPPPGQSTSGTDGRPTDTFPSPLPPEYTTFPDPAGEEGADVPAPVRPFLERLVFEDIPIRAPGGIRVDEALARAEFGGGLVLSGTGARPRLTGEIVAERGSLFLRENEFTLREGRVTFAGDGLYPSFALNAAGTVAAVTTRQRVPVVLDVRGQFEPQPSGQNVLNLQTTLSCAPGANGNCADPVTRTPYTEAQLYALVATGVPNLDALPENLASLGTSALQTALNIFVLGELERNVARALGLDVFRLTPNLAADGGEFGATITLGSYLTRDLYLQYQVDLTGEGLLDATYTTPDGRLSFQVSTPLGLGLQAVRPSISAAYNFGPRSSVSVGVANDEDSTTFRFGVTYRFFGR